MRLLLAALALPHLFAGWTSYAPMNSDQAIMTVPAAAPAGTEYAWVMAEGDGCDFTQIGWAWDSAWHQAPLDGPVVFAYTGRCGSAGQWYFGPQLSPGGSVTVRIVRQANTYTDEFLNPAFPGVWQVGLVDHLSWAPQWVVNVESYGPMERVCFAGRGCAG